MLASACLRFRAPKAVWPPVVAAASLVPLLAALSGDVTLSWRDTAQLQAPVSSLAWPALRDATLPLWNPLEGTGQPLLGQWVHAILHPVTIAVALLRGSVDGWLLGLIAYAATGTYFAARALGCTRPASSGAAWGYALSGYLLGMTGNVTYLAGAATAPWVVAGILLSSSCGGAFVLLGGAAVACSVFAGDPQAVITSAIIGGALAVARCGPAALWRTTASGAFGVALAAVQLLPTAAYFGTTARRAAGAEASFWPLDPPRLIELAAPGFFVGRPSEWVAPVFQALGSSSPYPLPWAPSVYIGVAALLLAAAAFPTRTGRVLLLLAALFAFLAMGPHLGAEQLLGNVPVWGSFRFAEKLVGPLTLCVSLAAAIGIDAAQETRWLGAAAVTTAILFMCFGLLCALAPGTVEALLGAARGAAGAARLARTNLLEGSLHAALGAGALAALLRWLPSSAPPPLLTGALAALMFAQASAAAPFAVHVGDAKAQAACPPALPSDPPGPRIFTAVIHNVTEPAAGMDPIDRLHWQLGSLGVPSANVGCNLDSLEGYTGFETTRAQRTIADPASRLALSRRFGVTHVTSEAPRDGNEAETLRQATAGGAPLTLTAAAGAWSVPHRQWASFAPAVRRVDDLDAATAALREELSSPTGAVVVETAVPPPTAQGRVLALRRDAERLEIEAEAAGDGLLVVNDAWAPGWRATIDGAPVPVLPADVLVRAVPFPRGRHRLVMVYAPPEVTIGVWVSLLASAAALAYALARVARRSTARGAPTTASD